jgi:hypothetical protein
VDHFDFFSANFMVNLHSDINIVIHRAYNPFNHCLLGAEPMKTFRSVEYWEVEWTIGTRYDGSPGEEEFTLGKRQQRRLTLQRLVPGASVMLP